MQELGDDWHCCGTETEKKGGEKKPKPTRAKPVHVVLSDPMNAKTFRMDSVG